MKITDLKCVVLGDNPVIRIVTDEGIDGYGEIESTNVERVMLKIRQRGSFKPWGSAVSAIEMALWDVAGKAAGVPVYKLLGGKVRDRVRIYNGGLRFPMETYSPEEYADVTRRMMAAPEGFTIIKQPIGFHSTIKRSVPDLFYGSASPVGLQGRLDRGAITERGLKHLVACVEAMAAVIGAGIGLALDCGPGSSPNDALKFAKAVEPYNLMWLEDMITGDYTPYVHADVYRDVTWNTTTPIHTGEQIYLRHNF